MGKKNKNKNKCREDRKKDSSILSLGKYTENFEKLEIGKNISLKDSNSDVNSYIPIEICDEEVYMTKPDGKLITDKQGQKKCDYLIYCKSIPQSCFIELKGVNISAKKSYNPYNQIIDTIKFLKTDDILKEIVADNIEKHAFIVSPGRQKIPKGIETQERLLWQQLIQKGQSKRRIPDLVHYVKVTKSERYSNNGNNGQIICSPKSPLKLPLQN